MEADGDYNKFKELTIANGIMDTNGYDEKKEGIIEDAYDFAVRNINRDFEKKESTDFISNSKRLLSSYPHILRWISQLSLQQVHYFDTYYRKNKRKELYKIIYEANIEIVGRFLFEDQENFQRKVAEDVVLRKATKDDIEKNGTVLYIPEIIEHLKKKNPKINLNIKKVVKTIVKNSPILDPYKSPIKVPTYGLQQRYVFKTGITLKKLFIFLISYFNDINKYPLLSIALLCDKVFYSLGMRDQEKLILSEGFG
jgi:hypothetical protein